MRIRNWTQLFTVTSLFVVVMTAAELTWGQSTGSVPQPAQSNVLKPKDKKQTLSFEDELIEGNTQKPELFYLFQKKNFNYKRLIRLRENFLPEMRKTSEDIQRTRGVN